MDWYKAELLIKMENELGEGPVWHPYDNLLYWVDIKKGIIYYYDPLKEGYGWFETEKGVSAAAPSGPKKLIVALPNAIVEFDCTTGEKIKITEIEPYERFNNTRIYF